MNVASFASAKQDRDYSVAYTGVSFRRKFKDYEAHIYYQKSSSIGKKQSVGRYTLACDAALARDVCAQQLGITFPPNNFATEIDYNTARDRELEQRKINLPQREVMTHLSSKVSMAINVVTDNEKYQIMAESFDEGSESDYVCDEEITEDEKKM